MTNGYDYDPCPGRTRIAHCNLYARIHWVKRMKCSPFGVTTVVLESHHCCNGLTLYVARVRVGGVNWSPFFGMRVKRFVLFAPDGRF